MGELRVLDRRATVRDDTVALLFTPGAPVEVRRPGDRLAPKLTPLAPLSEVLVMSTAPVDIDVTVDQMTTLDNARVHRCVVRLKVQLGERDGYAGLVSLAALHGTDIEDFLLDRVRDEVTDEVHAAMRMNRLADLQRLGVQHVLADRWLPRSFAGGVLERRNFAVVSVGWPNPELARLLERAALGPSDVPPVAAPRSTALELTTDVRLARLWRKELGSEVRGIAASVIDGSATVLAVADAQPGAHDVARLRAVLAEALACNAVQLIPIVAHSHDRVVDEWFAQVNRTPGRLGAAIPSSDGSVLRIIVNSPGGAHPDAARLAVGTATERAALRGVLPYDRVEFVVGGDLSEPTVAIR